MSDVVMRLPTVSPETLKKYYNLAHKRFYLRPKVILRRLLKIRNKDQLMQEVKGGLAVLNMFKTKKEDQAKKIYRKVLISDFVSANEKSYAALQLGVIYKNESEIALGYFQKALELNTNNEVARYNYELTLQLLEMDPEFSRKQRKKDKSKTPVGNSSADGVQGNALQQAGEGNQNNGFKKNKEKDPNKTEKQAKADANNDGQKNKGDKSAQVLEVNRNDLKDLNLSPEQAIQLLDAMQAAEIQYLQQAPKKRTLSKKDKENYKDW
jgi:hypothetical protein